TARPPGPRTPVRVVLDSRARLPLDSQLVATLVDAPVLVATDDAAPEESVDALRRAGCEVVRLTGENGRPTIRGLLDELGRRRMTNVLVEGGSAVLGNFRDTQGALDEIHVFIAPRLFGSARAKTPIGGVGASLLAEAPTLKEWHVQTIEDNVY